MGIAIDRSEFTDDDYRRFALRLRDNLTALEQLLATPGFGAGSPSFGAELELYLVDKSGRPLPVNQTIQQQLQDPQLTLELNRYNIEYNFSPCAIANHCLQHTEREALAALQTLNQCAGQWGGSAVPIGILPTLQKSDTGYRAMTKLTRYEALTKQLAKIRGGPFTVDIQGQDHFHVEMQDVTLEGACTSFQIHLRVTPENFADTYNALQLVTPLVLALSSNSPTLFGHRLWQETRVPLFKQSIDCRRRDPRYPRPARVNYGHGWLRRSVAELFAESVYLYQPILPIVSDESPLDVLANSGVPALHELRLQQGSVWLWNRPVYDPADGGHLRIEMRTLPAGPTVADMLANAALLIGLTELLRPQINQLLPAIPFDYCIRNFYRAAESGLDAELIWPSTGQQQLEYHRAADLLHQLLPAVPDALSRLGMQTTDYQPRLQVIEERLATGQTGSRWQLAKLAELETQMPRHQALTAMLRAYQQHSETNQPVAQWPQ